MKNKGFTLIELVVAIAILGVIMIVALPSISYIQKSNKDTKFRAYYKAVNTAGKAYNDSYSEDLFGTRNTGCAIIKYSDLKTKKLIEDIQVRNTDCGGENTCVVVRKSKNGNYHYETNMKCLAKNNPSEILFNNTRSSCSSSTCKIEDGQGPLYNIQASPNRTKYTIDDDDLKVTITIRDAGVGLKENQKLKYQWYKNDSP